MVFRQGLLLAVVAFCSKQAAAQLCQNTDYQVVTYRYSDTQCQSPNEMVALYQSGSVIRESTTEYKTFTCCDDKKTVTVTQVANGKYTYENVADDECLQGSEASLGGTGTVTEKSYTFECIENPPEASVTIMVYSGTTFCNDSVVPDIRLPTYEGCNEDFPMIMDLTCNDKNVTVEWSPNVVAECAALEYDTNVQSFELAPGCNFPPADQPYFGTFYSPIQLTTTCGTGGLSAGGAAAIVIIILLLLGGGGFAYYWFKIRPNKVTSGGGDFTEFNEYSQLDGQADTDLL